MEFTSRDLKTLIDACARGEPEARARFQEAYGALIYTFPVRLYHLSQDEAGDFYLFPTFKGVWYGAANFATW